MVRKAKINYFHQKFKTHYNNIKKTWATLNEILGRGKQKVYIPDFFKKGIETIVGNQNIAEEFNNFFTKIGPDLANKIPNSEGHFSTYLGERTNSNFKFCKVTDKIITEALKNIKGEM